MLGVSGCVRAGVCVWVSVSVNIPKKAWLLIGSWTPQGQGAGHVTIHIWQFPPLHFHIRLVGISFSHFLSVPSGKYCNACVHFLQSFSFWGWARFCCSLLSHRPVKYILTSTFFLLLAAVFDHRASYPLVTFFIENNFVAWTCPSSYDVSGNILWNAEPSLPRIWYNLDVLRYEYKPG